MKVFFSLLETRFFVYPWIRINKKVGEVYGKNSCTKNRIINLNSFLESMKNTYIILCLFLLNLNGFAQENAEVEYLSIDEAIQLALENNYNIQLAKNNKQIAENNTSKFNNGSLPTVTANAGTNYNYARQKTKTNGVVDASRGHSFPFSAGASVNYVLFDKSRKINISQLNQLNTLSDLQIRQSVESMLSNLYVAYYQVTTLERNIEVQQANLEISKRNLKRAEYAFEYGIATKLGILNSEVNVNNDSIIVQNSIVNFENSKRNLNVIMGRDPSINFTTDTIITYINDLNLDQLLTQIETDNIQLQLADQNIALDQLTLDISKTGWFPTVNANGGYSWSQRFNVNQPVDYIVNDGFNGGLNLSWNIFDGGRTKTAVQNATVAIESTQLFKEEILRQLQRDVYNNWMAYENALFVIETQQKNIETSERNFERSAEKFKLGNISTTTYREAQTNLLNTQLSYLNALYNAKVLETVLLQLSGNLVGQ